MKPAALLARRIFDDDHDAFRASFRTFVHREIVPYHEQWELEGKVSKAMFRAAGAAGFLGTAVPEHLGGGGVDDFRFNAIISEELQRACVGGSGMCITLHNNVCLPYLLGAANREQSDRWLPAACSGASMLALAMTEPGAGSDLGSMVTTAQQQGEHYVLRGAKTFITSALNCDRVIVAAKTDASQRQRGISLFVVDMDAPGVARGRPFNKMGLKSQDTADLYFDDVRVPAADRLGPEGTGFSQLMEKLAQERLGISVAAVAAAEAAFEITLDHAKSRNAFGQPIGSFQANRFALAEVRTEIDIARVFVDRLIDQHCDGLLSPEDAAKAKWWCTELQRRVVDLGVQLHGGSGYMLDLQIARSFLDARVQTIYGGTTQIMKEIIGRSLGV